jgi:hypothetical protein
VAYAHRLCYTSFAPPGFVPGQTALQHHRPPAPQDAQLRSSLLHQFQREALCTFLLALPLSATGRLTGGARALGWVS